MRLLSPALKAHGLEMDIDIHTYIFSKGKIKNVVLYVISNIIFFTEIKFSKGKCISYTYYVNIVSNAVASLYALNRLKLN